jgi:hypothetical protein
MVDSVPLHPTKRGKIGFYYKLAVPGHTLLWFIPVKWKSTKREDAHVSLLVGIQYFLWFLFCAAIEIVWFADPRTRNI